MRWTYKSGGGKDRKETTMKKKQGSFFGFAVLLIAAIFTSAGCATDGGGGDDPIQIETVAQFAEIRNNLSGHYILANDIDLSGFSNFEPIGRFEPLSDAPEDGETPKSELAFTGVFDGNGHKISHITISVPMGSGVGLFGCVADNGVVKNLIVENVTVSGMMLVGGVIGYGAAENAVEHITLQGVNTITGSYAMVGGIVGGGFCEIINCKATANVILNGDGSQNIGVLAGGMEDGSIINCEAKGTVTVTGAGAGGIGGLASCALSVQEVKNCTVDVTITITGENCMMIGGLVGYTGTYSPQTPTVISNCTVKAVITAPASAERIGGIAGSGFYMDAYKAYPQRDKPSSFKVQNCSTSGSITGGSLVGTIAGYIYDNSTVESSCTSTITGAAGDNLVGGDKATVDLGGLK
jgi:hypothetical protein